MKYEVRKSKQKQVGINYIALSEIKANGLLILSYGKSGSFGYHTGL